MPKSKPSCNELTLKEIRSSDSYKSLPRSHNKSRLTKSELCAVIGKKAVVPKTDKTAVAKKQAPKKAITKKVTKKVSEKKLKQKLTDTPKTQKNAKKAKTNATPKKVRFASIEEVFGVDIKPKTKATPKKATTKKTKGTDPPDWDFDRELEFPESLRKYPYVYHSGGDVREAVRLFILPKNYPMYYDHWSSGPKGKFDTTFGEWLKFSKATLREKERNPVWKTIRLFTLKNEKLNAHGNTVKYLPSDKENWENFVNEFYIINHGNSKNLDLLPAQVRLNGKIIEDNAKNYKN